VTDLELLTELSDNSKNMDSYWIKYDFLIENGWADINPPMLPWYLVRVVSGLSLNSLTNVSRYASINNRINCGTSWVKWQVTSFGGFARQHWHSNTG
jgi:hypothetical protein